MESIGFSSKYVDGFERIPLDIEHEGIRAPKCHAPEKFQPDAERTTRALPSLHPAEQRLMRQIEGRTYANIFGLVERLVEAKALEMNHDRQRYDQLSLRGLLQLSGELKHQQMFRHIERMAAAGMPQGYVFAPEPNAVASAVRGKSVWAVLALICHIELFALRHYRESIDLDSRLSALCKDVLLDHWREESKHAVRAELEWNRENAQLTTQQRDRAVDELIEIEMVIGRLLRSQSKLDADYFLRIRGWTLGRDDASQVRAAVLEAYRREYVGTSKQGRLGQVLTRLITPAQYEHLGRALSRI